MNLRIEEGEVKVVVYNKALFEKLIIDDQKDIPLVFDYPDMFFDVLQFVNADNVTQVYVSEIFMFEPLITHLIIICNDVNKIFTDGKEKFNIKIIQPFGYQQPVDFYAPKYDAPEARENTTPDLRTTIHWQPVVKTDSTGIASFEFYTADKAVSYSVIIEGLTENGQILRHEGKLWRQD